MIPPQSQRVREAENPDLEPDPRRQWGSLGTGTHGIHLSNVMNPAGLPGDFALLGTGTCYMLRPDRQGPKL